MTGIWCAAQEGEEIGLPMWPGMGDDGLGDEDAAPVMPRWLNVNLPHMNGARGQPAVGRIIGPPGTGGRAIGVGDLGGPRQAVEVRANVILCCPCLSIGHC